MTGSVGRQFVDAVAARDEGTLLALLADDVDFKGLTPGRLWEATSPDGVVDAVLGHWFGDDDHIAGVSDVEDGEPVADTRRISYRFRVDNGDGPHVVEQQVYYRERDGQMVFARALCSGYRPCD